MNRARKIIPLRQGQHARHRAECLLAATWHTKRAIHSTARRTRAYASVDAAIARMTTWAKRDGGVGDTFELYHSITSKWLVTIRVTARGRLVTTYAWEAEE